MARHDAAHDPERKLWFCGIEIDTGPSRWPFARLALARYPPCSADGAYLSEVAPVSPGPVVEVWPGRLEPALGPDVGPDLGWIRDAKGVAAGVRANGAGGVLAVAPERLAMGRDPIAGRRCAEAPAAGSGLRICGCSRGSGTGGSTCPRQRAGRFVSSSPNTTSTPATAPRRTTT